MAPTIPQQRAIALAPIPFAAISFCASCYVIYQFLCMERRKLERLYHRLVLAMNAALLPLAFTYAWSTFAAPAGTPNFAWASGTQASCTAQGFISQMFSITVPIYYGSFGLQAFVGVKNMFQEEKYRWIEWPIHLAAWLVPAGVATIGVVTENYNPNGSGCSFAKAPAGCEGDPSVPCERGEDIKFIEYTVGLGIIFLYLVFPPVVMFYTYCWLKRASRERLEKGMGMQQIRERARTQMMRQCAIQISLYLVSFWLTVAPSLISFAYQIVTGKLSYNLIIVSNCIFALQGSIMAAVYFSLEKMAENKVELVPERIRREGVDGLTVVDIKKSAAKKASTAERGESSAAAEKRKSSFNIFDGTPDKDSPWAQFFDLDEKDEDEDGDGHPGQC